MDLKIVFRERIESGGAPSSVDRTFFDIFSTLRA